MNIPANNIIAAAQGILVHQGFGGGGTPFRDNLGNVIFHISTNGGPNVGCSVFFSVRNIAGVLGVRMLAVAQHNGVNPTQYDIGWIYAPGIGTLPHNANFIQI